MVASEFKYAGFWLRALADFVDSILLDLIAIVAVFAVLGGAYWVQTIFFDSAGRSSFSWAEAVDSLGMQMAVVGSRVFFSLIYFTVLTSRFGTTPGKRLFRIYVISTETKEKVSLRQSLVRCLSYFASYITLGVGFMMAAFHPEKRALHDLISGTMSVVKLKGSSLVQ